MIIDTFPNFLLYWEHAHHRSLEDQIHSWAEDYLAPWPQLLTMLVEDYRSQGIDWREIARQRIFPHLAERLGAMSTAHANLLPVCEQVAGQTKQVLGFEQPITFLIYVGIGCGAGWATTWEAAPAVLLGLENIAEEGWTERDALEPLIAHEVSHLAYHHWRRLAGLPSPEGAWGQLIDEGFATYCESALVRPGNFHEEASPEAGDWSEWCARHTRWLAQEFLGCVASDQPVAKFFGSWLEIEGRSQTGYFLGNQIIEGLLEQGLSLREIALLDPQAAGRPALEKFGAGS